jgi:tetratricopeptide (TPR) repeat protein
MHDNFLVFPKFTNLLVTAPRFLFPLLTALFLAGGMAVRPENASAQAQSKPNPLEQKISDPLIPPFERPLMPVERRKLAESLEQLNWEARAELDAGNEEAAFELWYRELVLRRWLGPLAEISALGRVGAVAWDKLRTDDVQFITERLLAIQQRAESRTPLTPEMLAALATAYDQVHSLENSLPIYQKILANTRQQQDIKTEEETLNKIGQLYLAKFDYGKAAEVYEALLDIAQSQNNAYTEGIYLQQLAKIYGEASQPQNALRIKQELAENYLKNKNLQALPALKILIAADYEAINEPERASQTYQEAFSLAWSLQQFGAAGEALQKLAQLYRNYEQDDYALGIYNELIKVEQQSYNYYGQMKAYDNIGQIYLKQGNYEQAVSAFKKALEIARSLKYQEDYFLQRIQQAQGKGK